MPLGGRWKKMGEDWLQLEEEGVRWEQTFVTLCERDCCSKVVPRMVPNTQRRKIEEISRKRYSGNNRQRKRYEVLPSFNLNTEELLVIVWLFYKNRFKVGRQKYHTHTRLKEELRSLVTEFPDLASVYSIGLTAAGREILVIKICAGVSMERPLLRPQVKIVGGE